MRPHGRLTSKTATQRRPMRSLLLVGWVCAHVIAFPAPAEKLVVQLKWDHEFQFAGFYAAIWEGYYEEAGLEVELRPRVTAEGTLLNVVDEVTSGRADIGLGATDILLARDGGERLVVLASIFQQSPYALYALAEKGINSPADLVGHRVGYSPTDLGSIQVEAILRSSGLPSDAIVRAPLSVGLTPLLEGKYDVGVNYGVSAEWWAKEQGIDITTIYPRDYALPFYGDSLFTHATTLKQKREAMEKFVEASIRGWEYALANSSEIAERITETYERSIPIDDFLGYNLFESRAVRNWMNYPYTPIGSTNAERWRRIYARLTDLGLVSGNADLEGLVYHSSQTGDEAGHDLMTLLFAACILGATAAMILFLLTPARTLLLPAAGLLCIFLLTVTMDYYNRRAQIREARYHILDEASVVRARLEGALNSQINLLRGLALSIGLEKDLGQERFAFMAAEILDTDSYLRHLAAAPDLVIRYIHPLAGNQAALGLDYRQEPSQREDVLAAMETGEVVVAGPVDLVQGGRALIARVPVFALADTQNPDGQPRPWGVLSGVIDMDPLFSDVGLTGSYGNVSFALRDLSGAEGAGELLYGDGGVFTMEPVLQDLLLPNNAWKLAAVPQGGWAQVDKPPYLIWVSGGFLMALILALSIVRYRQRTERARNALALRLSEARRARAQEMALLTMLEYDANTDTVELSPEFKRLTFRFENAATVNRDTLLQCFHPEDRARVHHVMDAMAQGQETIPQDARLMMPSGEERHVVVQIDPLDPERNDGRALLTVQDIEARHAAQRQMQQLQDHLRKAQKMEAIGHLAGGIAHDFNNILAAIMGYAELAQTKISRNASPESLAGYHEEITQSAMRARDLVQQILTFSRVDMTELRATQPADEIRQAAKMLRAMLPSTVSLAVSIKDDNARILSNPAYLNQIMLNLVLNAKAAIDVHGRIEVQLTREQVEDATCASCHGHFSGEYVVLTVRDDGCGILPQHRERIFEPFYSTRPMGSGKGTGMGLAVVHGMVHRSDGHILLDSTAGAGTCMRLYFPVVEMGIDPRNSWMEAEDISRLTS